MGNFRKISNKYYFREILACWLVYCLFFSMPMVARAVEDPASGALPSYTPGNYAVGAGGIDSIVTNGSNMTLNSVANGTVIYINNHDIGSLASVTYNQVPDGWALVKINDTLDSTFYGDGAVTGIAGILTATGNFIISNSEGIYSAPGSFINARNLVISAMRINDTDFSQFVNRDIDELKFNTQFENGGLVTINGDISGAESVYIAAKNITNAGTISSPGGCVVMAAGNSARIGRPGSNVAVEVSLGTTYPDERVVDNGGSYGTGTGTIEATGGKVILAAGDIYSTAIEGIESLRAEATGDITLNGAIGASGHVEILGGQNRIISRHAQIYINDDITAGSMRIKNGKDTEPGEESLSGIYVAVDKNLEATAGDVVVEAVHDVILGGDVLATGDVFINGDEDGWGDPKGENYNPRAYGGGDVIANNITAGVNVDIKGNAIELNGEVIAAGGDLTITGRTSKDVYTYFSENGIDVEWGYIDVAEGTILGASHDVILKDAFGSGGDEEPPAGEMDLFGHGGLVIIAEGGSIQTEGPFGEGVKITVEDLSPAFLAMVQADPLNLADYSFGNQNNTDLYLQSLNGSVTAVDSSQLLSGKNENAADQWGSITAYAKTDITLQGHDLERDITAGALISYAADFDTGNITVTSDNSKVLLTGNVSANQGSVAVTAIDGGIVSSGDILASDGITLFGEVTADGEGDQTFDAGQGTLWAKDTLSTITKITEGGLTLGGDTLVDLDGIEDSVWVQAGPLTIEDSVDVEGNLVAQGIIHLQGMTNNVAGDILSTGSGIIFDHDVTADGVGSQTFDAGTGKLIAENEADIDKITAGSLTLAGDTGIELGGNVTGSGMTSVDSLMFKNNVIADGTGDAVDQRLDAGLGALDADYSITKTTAGNLNLGGDEGIELGGNVETTDGDLTFEDAVTANGGGNQLFDAGGHDSDLVAWDDIDKTTSGDLTLDAAYHTIELYGDVSTVNGDLIFNTNVEAKGDGAQRFAAGHTYHDLEAEGDIIKTTDGDLTLGAGEDPSAHIYLAGDVTTSNGDLIFEDDVIADGEHGNQLFDADGIGTDLIADDDIIKTTAGNLTLGAGTQPDAQIELGGDVTTTDGDITLWDKVIANGSGNQKFDAVSGKLWATDTITKTSSGDLNLGGDDAIDLDGTVDVDAGSLTIEDDFTAVADLIASENVTLEGTATLNGSVNQKIEAENGTLYAKVSVHKTGAGDLKLKAGDDITIGRPFSGEGNVTANGNMDIIAGTDSDDSVKVLGKLTTTNGGNINVQAGDDIKLYGTFNGPEFESAQADGDLTLHAGYDIDVLGDLISNNGSIELSSDVGTTYLGGNVTAAIDVTLNNNTEFDHVDDQKVDAQTGTITAKGRLRKNSDWGSLYLEAAGDISLADDVRADYGGVSIISENGKIFTPDECGYETDTLNVSVYGYSDDYYGDGVDLLYGPGKAAILIASAEDLKLGPDSELIASGYYDDTTVDDRQGVGFLDEPLTAIGGIIRDEGDPIDVAIYLASTTGNVDVESQYVSVDSGGTMVVDAYDTVTLGDMTSEPAMQTIEISEGRFWEIDRLEVASRITEWLFEADAFGTLPYPYNPEIVEAFIGGEYVLRGAGLGNPAILDGRAWVLEDPLDPAPLYEEAGEAAEEQAFAEGGCPQLMNWLSNEIGVPAEDIQVTLAGALALNTDVQPCEMCARLMDAATTLEDADGARIAAMARVVNEFVTTPAPPSPEQMTQIAAALSEHVGDGTYYALAGEWIDALVAYVGIMNTEMGYSASDAAAFAQKYLTPVAESGNVSLNAYVQARLAALGG